MTNRHEITKIPAGAGGGYMCEVCWMRTGDVGGDCWGSPGFFGDGAENDLATLERFEHLMGRAPLYHHPELGFEITSLI